MDEERLKWLAEQRLKTPATPLRPVKLGPTPGEILLYQQDKKQRAKDQGWFKKSPKQKRYARRKYRRG
jgi:hypothetical protein